MRKIIFLGIGAIAFTSACTSSPAPSTDIAPAQSISRVSADECADRTESVQRLLESAGYALDSGQVLEAKSRARRAITAGRSVVTDCAYLAPAEARSFERSLNELEDSL